MHASMAAVGESVLIGFCDEGIGKNTASFSTNKIGGLPDCLPAVSLRYPSCALCSTDLTHVVQVYCPLATSPYHRTINVFACLNPLCQGKSESWTVLRSQCLDKPVCEDHSTKCTMVKEAPMATRDWCEEADDWGEAEEGPDTSAPACSSEGPVASTMPDLDFSMRMQGLKLVEGGDCSLSGRAFDLPGQVSTFCSHYISVMEEGDLSCQTDLEHEQRLLQEYERREGVAVGEMESCESGNEVEKYEKAEARHGDQVFSKFMKKISLCPEQILRYCWSGSPLLITDPLSNVVPDCSCCGGPRTFEFQLMPALVSLLRSAESNLEMVVEFGTVLIYTCRRSCWEIGLDTPLQEFVFVQTDPDQKFFQ